MATTATLEAGYWKNQDQREVRTLQADTVVRTFIVPITAWDTLKPSVADTFSTDSSQIVVSVEQGKRQGNDANMVVTYVKLATKAGFTDGYAETRRIEQKRNLRVIFTTYGLATSIVSTGIPDVKDTLTGETVGLDAICTDVVLDDRVYPGLVSVQATWVRVRTYINYKHTNTATTTATATDTDTLTRTKTKTNTNSATGTVSGSTTVTLTKTDTDTNSATKSKTSTTTATLSQTVTGDT